MANQLGSNPWVLDTAGAAILYNTDIKAAHFEWEGAANGNTIQVKDRFGKIIWAAVWATGQSLVESFTIEWIHGLALTVLDGGILRVYFK